MMSYDTGGPVATTLPYHIAGPQSYSYTRESAHQPAVGTPRSHQHSRSSSSNTFPSSQIQPYSQRTPQNPLRSTNTTTTAHSRQPSNASITPTTANMSMQRAPTTGSTASSAPRRSTSSRSSTGTSTPTSYVALMRKQKATVWCDRSQSLDAHTVAVQRAAKHRAIMEVHGAGLTVSSGGRTSTISSGGVVGKIRHGGVPRAPGYIPSGNLSGAGVPMRLSANEMLGDEEEASSMHTGDNSMVHARTGSGRSSTNSANYRSGYPRTSSLQQQPGSSGNQSPHDGIPETAETRKDEYFGKEEEDSFGGLGAMQAPSAVQKALTQAKNAEDLRRRGSVDERAMSMGTGVRLFVANPDVD